MARAFHIDPLDVLARSTVDTVILTACYRVVERDEAEAKRQGG